MKKICKGREEQKQWATAHFSFSVAIESPGCDKDACVTVSANSARAS